jgi:hypothetical protein
MNPIIGIIGNHIEAVEFINQQLLPNDIRIELDQTATIDELKTLRQQLAQPGLSRKVGIVYRLNRLSLTHQAILLKIFEELPEFNACFFTASFLPSYTIMTRSQIHYVNTIMNESNIRKMHQHIFEAMKQNVFSPQHARGWRIFLQTYSFYMDNMINEKEKNTILAGLGWKTE